MDIGYFLHHEATDAVDHMVYGSDGISETIDPSYYLYDEQIIDHGNIYSELALMTPRPQNPTVCSLFFPPLQLNLAMIATRFISREHDGARYRCFNLDCILPWSSCSGERRLLLLYGRSALLCTLSNNQGRIRNGVLIWFTIRKFSSCSYRQHT